LAESALSIFWEIPWVKTRNLIDCLRLNPKEAFFEVVNFHVICDLWSLRIPFLIKLVSELNGPTFG